MSLATREVVAVDEKAEAKSREMEVTRSTAASTIQRIYKQKRPLIRPLDEKSLTEYGVNLVGNDPDIKGLAAHAVADKPVALVATGAVRAVELACQLGNRRYIPKVFIIDNSSQVKLFWNWLRKYVKQHRTPESFLRGLSVLRSDPHLLVLFEWVKILSERGLGAEFVARIDEAFPYLLKTYVAYFKSLFDTYGFEHVCAIIENTLFINQSFADRPTFERLQSIFGTARIENIFVYASNIIAYVEQAAVRDRIFENIALLNPKASIHSNVILHKSGGFGPGFSKVYTDATPDAIKKDLLDVCTQLSRMTKEKNWIHHEAKDIAYLEHESAKVLEGLGKKLTAAGLRVKVGRNAKTKKPLLYVYEASKVRECNSVLVPSPPVSAAAATAVMGATVVDDGKRAVRFPP